MRKSFKVNARHHVLALGRQTKIMGIVNMTPDSFSEDGLLSKRTKKTTALQFAKKLIKDGADILDIGGESTRPGSSKISAKEEIKRVIPTISAIAKSYDIPISVDTYKTEVAQHALDAGASIVNNIMGTSLNKSLLKMIRNYDAAIVLMHIQGTPKTMQKDINYSKIIDEIIVSLQKSIENCLASGIKSDRIVVDPGIGFGKTVEHNLEIINRLKSFNTLNKPLLIGPSRKSFIGKVLDRDVTERLMGTAASVCASILNGAHIVRVHDVQSIKDVAKMSDAILTQQVTSV